MDEQKIADFTRVATLLEALTSNFEEHKIEDDDHNTRLYGTLRKLPDQFNATRKELEEHMEKHYVPQSEFREYKASIKGLKWAIWGAFTMFSVLTWVLSKVS